MSDAREGSETEDQEKTLFESLKERWWLVLVLIFGLLIAGLICNYFATNPDAVEVVAGYLEDLFGGGDGGPTEPVCGNSVCEDGESPETCQQDCSLCGNEVCDTGEDVSSCPADCSQPPPTDEPTSTDEPTEDPTETEEANIGDGTCNATCVTDADCLAGLSCLPVAGQTFSVCWNDQICDPEATEGTEEGPGGGCGNGTCETNESPATCPADCGLCGNGVCDPGEHVYNCSVDCGEPPLPPPPVNPYCGDGICNGGETCYSCFSDCYPSACP